MPDPDDITNKDASKGPTEQAASGGASGEAASGLSTAQSGGTTDAGALNPDAGKEPTKETPPEAAKDPNKDPSVAGTKLFAGQNTPASAVNPFGDSSLPQSYIESTPHKVKGFDVTQPPALDLDTGLSRTTLFEKTDD